MTAHPTVLAVLLEDRGLHRYGSFSAAYGKAASGLDKQLAHSAPSRAQFHRWLTGELRRLPYTDHCRVLEHMLPGYSTQQLLAPLPRPGRPGSRACRARDHRGLRTQPPGLRSQLSDQPVRLRQPHRQLSSRDSGKLLRRRNTRHTGHTWQ